MSETDQQTLDWRVRTTLTVEESAKVVGISRGAAYEAVRRGDLPHLVLGRRIVVPVAQLRRLLGEAS